MQQHVQGLAHSYISIWRLHCMGQGKFVVWGVLLCGTVLVRWSDGISEPL
jgi:hypothetical protein